MRLRNINGTSERTCRCGGWLDHWKRFSGQSLPGYCPVNGCYNKDLVGAHVQKDNWYDNDWYIIPLCAAHNKKSDALELSDDWTLVSANVSATCGRVNAR